MHYKTEKLYLRPSTIAEAIRLALHYKDQFRYMGGGTDVLVNKFQGNENSECLIDLCEIAEMKQIQELNQDLRIGALVTLDALHRNPYIHKYFPALTEAAKAAATPVLRKTATLGGNLLCDNRCSFYNQSEWWRQAVGYCLKCNGDICIATGGVKKCFSRFISDTAPVLISFNAKIQLEDETGEKQMPLEELYTGDGINPFRISKTSIIKNILLPLDKKYDCAFMKLRPRASMDFTSLTTAVSLCEKQLIKIVVGGMDPMPIVIGGSLENREELIQKAIKKPRTIDNDIYSRTYRKEMIGVFLRRSFDKILNTNSTAVH